MLYVIEKIQIPIATDSTTQFRRMIKASMNQDVNYQSPYFEPITQPITKSGRDTIDHERINFMHYRKSLI